MEDGLDLGLEMSNTNRSAAATKTSRPRAASGLANIFEGAGPSTRGAGESDTDSDGEGDDEVGNPIHLPGTLSRNSAGSGRRATIL